MLPVINLSSSTDTNALVNAIAQANIENRSIVLQAGPHLTQPGSNHQIAINNNGLHISGSLSLGEYSSIKRADASINISSITHLPLSSNNYGLFFVPSEPAIAEWESVASWSTHTNADGTTFNYAVIVRGAILIENLELDCNMGNQGLPTALPDASIEQSAMLGFAGKSYSNSAYPGKRIYVAFESVTLNNIITTRGGYADDIWISRGYFRPNILKVSINKISSNNRINNKRATISFSGLAQNIEITDANIYQLHAESTSDIWSELPGTAINSEYSNWKLRNVNCEVIDLAAKGKAIFLDADHIISTTSTGLYELGGNVQNSTFKMLPQATTLNRLNNIVFKKVEWIFSAYQDSLGYFIGIAPRAQYQEECSATFVGNTFKVNGELINNSGTKGLYLIETEYSSTVPGNSIRLKFDNCIYDERFINAGSAKMYVAKVFERGSYIFDTPLLGLANPGLNNSLLVKPNATIDNLLPGILNIAIQ
jgi:hypothetical protein